MTSRFYVVEMVNNPPYRSPKYFGGKGNPTDANLGGIVGFYNDYGVIDQCIVYVKTIDPAHEAYLDTLPDVLAIPSDLDAAITAGQVAGIRSALQARDIPGSWINAGDTYRQAMRETMWVFDFMKRYTAFANFNPIAAGVNLNTALGAVTVNQWQNLRNRYVQALTEIDPDTIILEPPDGRLHTQYTAWHNVTVVEALAAGMSQANVYKCAALVVLDQMNFDLINVQASTTFGDVLRAVGNNRTNVPFLWAGANVTI